MNSAGVIRRLQAEGWLRIGGKGDHFKLKHPDRAGHVVCRMPRKDLALGTLRNIHRQAGWTWG
jgi:predicted RNA binding protein YcfA (HicA-like mRNA interferase family)